MQKRLMMLRVVGDVSVEAVFVCCPALRLFQRAPSPHFLSFCSFDGLPWISHTGGLFIDGTCQEREGVAFVVTGRGFIVMAR